jgi:hypothetical protein
MFLVPPRRFRVLQAQRIEFRIQTYIGVSYNVLNLARLRQTQ